MTYEHSVSYNLHLLDRISYNARANVLDGNAVRATELAVSAAHIALECFPELRENLSRNS